MTLRDCFGDWMNIIDINELAKVTAKLNAMYNDICITPNKEDVFKSFYLCPVKNLKIVFLGQDPYPQKGVATGILFGNNKDVTEDKLSPSLQIVKRACIDYTVPHSIVDFDNTLETWAKQGILMLNSSLTCEVNNVGSHVMLWRPFIASLLKKLSNNYPGIVYVLFGNTAQTFVPYINPLSNNIIKVNHPAWYARMNVEMPNSVFKDIDSLLISKYGSTIKWFNEY